MNEHDKGKLEINGQTFIIDIKCRENYTWQGTVRWVQGDRQQYFRSALELLKLIDSAVDSSEE